MNLTIKNNENTILSETDRCIITKRIRKTVLGGKQTTNKGL